MQKRIGFFLCLIIFSQNSFAETCPSVATIKANTLTGWRAYDSDEGTPLSTARQTAFQHLAEQFVLAEWTIDHHAIRCYYRGKHGMNLEAYLAKENFRPSRSTYWYKVTGSLHCAAGMQQCEFHAFS